MANSIRISGRVVREVELRYIPNGTAVCEFTILNKQGKSKTYVRIEAWDKLAERLTKNLGQNDKVIVHGSLIEQSWKDNNGKKRSIIKVRARNVICVDEDDDDEQ